MFFAAEEGDARGDRHNLRLVGNSSDPNYAQVNGWVSTTAGHPKVASAAKWHQSPALSHQEGQAEQEVQPSKAEKEEGDDVHFT